MRSAVYLSLGSNLGDRAANLQEAIRRLGALGTVRAASGFYETEPVEVEDEQPWFLNCTVLLETELSPQSLLAGTLKLEQSMGRRRNSVRSARQIDIDILYFGDLVLAEPDLTIPHPGAARRKFVLAPMAEIAPDFRDPVTKQTATEMLLALDQEAPIVRKWRG